MKRHFAYILIAFVFSNINAQILPGIVSSQVVSVAEEGTDYDLIEESFEGTGYENTFTELIGGNSGCIVDEDNTDVARPTGGGSQVLKIVKVITPTATAAESAALAVHNFGSDIPIVYLSFYVRVNAHGISGSDVVILYQGVDAGYDIANNLKLKLSSTDLRFAYNVRTGGAYSETLYPASGSISLDTWYKVEIKFDYTNMAHSCSIDGNSVASGSLTSTTRVGIKRIYFGEATNVKTVTHYIDLVKASTTAF